MVSNLVMRLGKHWQAPDLTANKVYPLSDEKLAWRISMALAKDSAQTGVLVRPLRPGSICLYSRGLFATGLAISA